MRPCKKGGSVITVLEITCPRPTYDKRDGLMGHHRGDGALSGSSGRACPVLTGCTGSFKSDRNVPASPVLQGGAEGHNIKGNYLTGKPRPLGVELQILDLKSNEDSLD
jgi:hypothetical protein